MGISEDPKKKRKGRRFFRENPNSGFQVDEFKVVYIPERTNICTLNKRQFLSMMMFLFPSVRWDYVWMPDRSLEGHQPSKSPATEPGMARCLRCLGS